MSQTQVIIHSFMFFTVSLFAAGITYTYLVNDIERIIARHEYNTVILEAQLEAFKENIERKIKYSSSEEDSGLLPKDSSTSTLTTSELELPDDILSGAE